MTKKPEWMDKDWTLHRTKCPHCRRFLFYDNNDNKNATHFCLNCGGMTIVGNCMARGEN